MITVKVQEHIETEGDLQIQQVDLGESNFGAQDSEKLSSANINVSTCSDIREGDLEVETVDLEPANIDTQSETDLDSTDIQVAGGFGVKFISQIRSDADSGENIITFTVNSGQKFDIIIKNGSKGDPGNDADIEGCNNAIERVNGAIEKAELVNAEIEGYELTITSNDGTKRTVNTRGEKGATGDRGATTPTSLDHYTLQQYFALREEGKVENMFYSIYEDGVLTRVYLGESLFAKKASDGETVTMGSAFPLIFPVIFA